MNRAVAIPAIAVLIGLPLWDLPSWPIAIIGAVGGAMSLIAILGLSVSLLRAGALVALINYTLALWWSAAPVELTSAALFGLVLLFLFDLNWFAWRFQRAEIAPDVIRLQISYWLKRAALIAATVFLLVLGAQLLALEIPVVAGVATAGVGGLIAFFAAVRAATAHNRRT